MSTTRERLRQMVQERPDMDQSELAAALGVSRQRINQLVHDEKDPVMVAARFNLRKVNAQLALARIVGQVQQAMRDMPPPRTWREICRAAGVSNNLPGLLRDREPTFYQVITQTLATNRAAWKAQPAAGGG